jgi:LPS sulfotransferase NodH
MNDGQRLVLFAHARTGSTSLMHLLNLHPEIRMCHEPFHPSHATWYPGEENHIDVVKDESVLDAQLSKIFQRYTGIKTLSYQLPDNLYERLLSRDDMKVIFLSRRNILQAAVSGFVARQTNVWQSSDLEKSGSRQVAPLEPVPVDQLRETLKYYRELDSVYREIVSRKPSTSTLEIFYEDVFSGDLERNRSALLHIFRFIGLDMPQGEKVGKLLDPGQTKVTTETIYRSIPNAALIDQELGSNETGWLIARDA